MNLTHAIVIILLVITIGVLVYLLRPWYYHLNPTAQAKRVKRRENKRRNKRINGSVEIHGVYNDRSFQILVRPNTPLVDMVNERTLYLNKQGSLFDKEYIVVYTGDHSLRANRLTRFTVLNLSKVPSPLAAMLLDIRDCKETHSLRSKALSSRLVKEFNRCDITLNTPDGVSEVKDIDVRVSGVDSFNAIVDGNKHKIRLSEDLKKTKLSLLEKKQMETRGFLYLYTTR